jgi:hypothetical protein
MDEYSYDSVRCYSLSRKQLGYSAPQSIKLAPDPEPELAEFDVDPLRANGPRRL